MAQYKVPQDVEADDKLIGPFSFRQFVYLLIAGGLIALAVALELDTGIEVAEVKDWEYSHKSLNSTYQSLKHAIDGYFKGEIRIAIRGEHLYIARLEK